MVLKISIILIAIFSGWLFTEIKEFLVHGGYDNKLAVVLLKIIFIFNAIFVCILWDIISQKYFSEQIDSNNETPGSTPESVNFLNLNKSLAKSNRSKSKSRKTRYTDHFNFNSE